MEEERFMYHGKISDCGYKDFFQILFCEENFGIAKKIITDSEYLYKYTQLYESDYFIKDMYKQSLDSYLNEDISIDEQGIEHNSTCNEFNENNFEHEASEPSKYMESKYNDEKISLDLNNAIIEISPIVISTSLFSEKGDFVYINLKMSTIVLLALLVDNKMPTGLASAILGAIGLNTTLITKIKEENGEKCILFEICSKNDRKVPLDFFDKFVGKECVNNHFRCTYCREGKCTITKDKIDSICSYFISRNIIRHEKNEYKYNI